MAATRTIGRFGALTLNVTTPRRPPSQVRDDIPMGDARAILPTLTKATSHDN
jgi:hypothetical protein